MEVSKSSIDQVANPSDLTEREQLPSSNRSSPTKSHRENWFRRHFSLHHNRYKKSGTTLDKDKNNQEDEKLNDKTTLDSNGIMNSSEKNQPLLDEIQISDSPFRKSLEEKMDNYKEDLTTTSKFWRYWGDKPSNKTKSNKIIKDDNDKSKLESEFNSNDEYLTKSYVMDPHNRGNIPGLMSQDPTFQNVNNEKLNPSYEYSNTNNFFSSNSTHSGDEDCASNTSSRAGEVHSNVCSIGEKSVFSNNKVVKSTPITPIRRNLSKSNFNRNDPQLEKQNHKIDYAYMNKEDIHSFKNANLDNIKSDINSNTFNNFEMIFDRLNLSFKDLFPNPSNISLINIIDCIYNRIEAICQNEELLYEKQQMCNMQNDIADIFQLLLNCNIEIAKSQEEWDTLQSLLLNIDEQIHKEEQKALDEKTANIREDSVNYNIVQKNSNTGINNFKNKKAFEEDILIKEKQIDILSEEIDSLKKILSDKKNNFHNLKNTHKTLLNFHDLNSKKLQKLVNEANAKELPMNGDDFLIQTKNMYDRLKLENSKIHKQCLTENSKLENLLDQKREISIKYEILDEFQSETLSFMKYFFEANNKFNEGTINLNLKNLEILNNYMVQVKKGVNINDELVSEITDFIGEFFTHAIKNILLEEMVTKHIFFIRSNKFLSDLIKKQNIENDSLTQDIGRLEYELKSFDNQNRE